ncbi:MAG: hypothetical protein A4E60_00219 [Syntrophorhabdus sp. PtaB.Bin047]|nr:MAG: hypothetical protein A4E60_00219 [Syntrophorhabdus sp. PtaB.Bin047]
MQHSYNITNLAAKGGSAYRAAVNAALQALATQNEGPDEPAVTYPSMLWPDTTASLLKLRNQADDGWLTIGNLEEVHLGLAALAAENEFVTTQKLKGDGLLVRMKDTGASGEEWAIRSDGGNLEIVKNTGTEGSPTWTVQTRIDVNALRVGNGTASDIDIIANNDAVNKPTLRYQASGSKWQYSNDGSLFNDLGVSTSVEVPVRQTVLSAVIDSYGKPTFISVGTGLAVNIDASPTPVRIAFAAGFGASGAVNYVGTIDEDTSISSLTASSINYLYAERNPSTGAITLGKTAVMPVYSYSAPSHASNQYWYSIAEGVMYLSNGSDTWTAQQVVFLGEAVTDGSSVTSVVNYALAGRYDSGYTNNLPANATTVSFSHNIGVRDIDVQIILKCISAEAGYLVDDQVEMWMEANGTEYSPRQIVMRSRNVIYWQRASSGPPTMIAISNGNRSIANSNNWAYKVIAKRRF